MQTINEQISSFWKNISYGTTDSEGDLESFTDPFVTEEQKARDSEITKLLKEYVSWYKSKVKHSKICRYFILIPCILIICGFAGLLGYFGYCISVITESVGAEELTAFITACISFISLIISILAIITKYFFPENDEQYITKIVETIQKNDLDNKRENAKNQIIKNDSQET